MANLDDLEASLVKCADKLGGAKAEFDEVPELEGEELLMYQDVIDAIELLKKCMHLLDYMSDTDLCKSITKREREVMGRVSNSVGEYLDEVVIRYEED